MTPCLALPNTRTESDALADLDLSVPSYRAAYQFARRAAFDSAKVRGAKKPSWHDKAAGDAVMIRLLWHVEGERGGFIGLSDSQLAAYCERKNYDIRAVNAASYAPGDWPTAQVIEFPGIGVDPRVGASRL